MPRLFPAAAPHDDLDVLAFDIAQVAQSFTQVAQARLEVGDAEDADPAQAALLINLVKRYPDTVQRLAAI